MVEVIPVAEARAGLSAMLSTFRHDEAAEPVVIGAHRRPEAVLLPFEGYRRLAERGHGVTLEQLRRLAPLISRLADASHLTDVRVYGSVARGEQTVSSDVDLLATPVLPATLFDVAQFELDMEMLLGVPVSVVPATALDTKRDASVIREAIAL